MFFKTVLRLIRVACFGFGLLFASLCFAGYLAMQQPAFYAESLERRPTEAEIEAATTRLEAERARYVRWRSELLSDRPLAVAPAVHEVRFTDAQLNALLASETKQVGEVGFEEPRLRIAPGRLELACGVKTSAGRCVFSAALAPALTPEGVLTLGVESARVGNLPLPLGTLLGWLPRERRRVSGKLELDLTGPQPRFALDLSDEGKEFLAQSVECGDGEFVVRFAAAREQL